MEKILLVTSENSSIPWNLVQELGKAYGVEHLAGPQGFAVRYLFENQDKEILSKISRKGYLYLNQWLVIWSNVWRKTVSLNW